MHVPTAVFAHRPTLRVAHDFVRGMSAEEFAEFFSGLPNQFAFSGREAGLLLRALNTLEIAKKTLPPQERHLPKHGRRDRLTDDLNIIARIALHAQSDDTLEAIAQGIQDPAWVREEIYTSLYSMRRGDIAEVLLTFM